MQSSPDSITHLARYITIDSDAKSVFKGVSGSACVHGIKYVFNIIACWFSFCFSIDFYLWYMQASRDSIVYLALYIVIGCDAKSVFA